MTDRPVLKDVGFSFKKKEMKDQHTTNAATGAHAASSVCGSSTGSASGGIAVSSTLRVRARA